jgi:acyl transferase domain-containing protein
MHTLVSEVTKASVEPRRGLFLGARSKELLIKRLMLAKHQIATGGAVLASAVTKEGLASPLRLAIDYRSSTQLSSYIEKALLLLSRDDDQAAAWQALRGQGVFFGCAPRGKLAFIYPGQGAQYPGMLAQAYAQEPLVRRTLDEISELMRPVVGLSLDAVHHGHGLPGAPVETLLRDISVAHPAVLGASVALTRLLASHGIQPDMLMGHSLGEYSALVAAGVLSLADATRIVCMKGGAWRRWTNRDGGAMAVVEAPAAEVGGLLETIEQGYVVVANINGPHQTVIAGHRAAVEKAASAFEKRGCRVFPLPVCEAFHSELIRPAAQILHQLRFLERAEMPRIPVVSSLTGRFYQPAVFSIGLATHLVEQLCRPVQFVTALNTMHVAGARVFVEVGPKRILSRLVDTLFAGDDEVTTICTNHPKVDDQTSLHRAICALFAAGIGSPRRSRRAASRSRSAEVTLI